MTALDLSAYLGIVAVLLTTANICLGLLIAVRYSPVRLWPHRRINIFMIHTWTAYALLASILLHPIILLFVKLPRWRFVDIALPLWSPVQPFENTVGAVALYLVVVVLLTSYFRLRIGRPRWKRFHYLVYAAGLCIFLHGILADPTLKGNRLDLLDGEKLILEACMLVAVMMTAWAWRYRLGKRAAERQSKANHSRDLASVNQRSNAAPTSVEF